MRINSPILPFLDEINEEKYRKNKCFPNAVCTVLLLLALVMIVSMFPGLISVVISRHTCSAKSYLPRLCLDSSLWEHASALEPEMTPGDLVEITLANSGLLDRWDLRTQRAPESHIMQAPVSRQVSGGWDARVHFEKAIQDNPPFSSGILFMFHHNPYTHRFWGSFSPAGSHNRSWSFQLVPHPVPITN